jgi:hypothetical protein
VHVESDRFFQFIRSGFVGPWRPESAEQNAVVMRIVAEAAAAYASAGYFTIVDGIVLPRFFFEPLRDALRQAGHAVAYAVLRAPLNVCLARAGSRDSQPLADPLVVERLWHRLRGPGAALAARRRRRREGSAGGCRSPRRADPRRIAAGLTLP